mgnify:CR=1 FL=1
MYSELSKGNDSQWQKRNTSVTIFLLAVNIVHTAQEQRTAEKSSVKSADLLMVLHHATSICILRSRESL